MTLPNANKFLLQITVAGTSDPVVGRTLAVPHNVSFLTLHHAITACFGYSSIDLDNHNPKRRLPVFEIIDGDPFGCETFGELRRILTLWNKTDYVSKDKDAFLMEKFPVQRVFGSFEYRDDYMLYDYSGKFYHIIEFLGNTAQGADKEIFCVGAKGVTTRKGSQRGRSSWEVSLDEVQTRLKAVEDRRLQEQQRGQWKKEVSTVSD
ncbi:MAG: hypothetical protein Q9163_000324 [Psora crenata]